MRPQCAAQGLAAEPGAAALVGDRPAPTAHTVVTSVYLRPAAAAGTDNDNAPIPASMSPDAGRLRVRDENGFAEWVLVGLRHREVARLTRSSQRKTGDNPAKIARRQVSFGQALSR